MWKECRALAPLSRLPRGGLKGSLRWRAFLHCVLCARFWGSAAPAFAFQQRLLCFLRDAYFAVSRVPTLLFLRLLLCQFHKIWRSTSHCRDSNKREMFRKENSLLRVSPRDCRWSPGTRRRGLRPAPSWADCNTGLYWFIGIARHGNILHIHVNARRARRPLAGRLRGASPRRGAAVPRGWILRKNKRISDFRALKGAGARRGGEPLKKISAPSAS